MRGICSLAAAVSIVLAPRARPEEHRGTASAVVVAPPSESPSRDRTYGKVSRELEERRRALEELSIRIGDEEPTAAQRIRKHALTAEIGELETEREQIEQRESAPPADDSLHARWARYRAAFRDITSWTVLDGLFRFGVGMRAQIDVTAGVQETALEESAGPIDEGLNLRRGSLYAKGRVLRAMDFWVEYDFGPDGGLKKAYIDGTGASDWVANHFRWRLGKFQEPFGIARTTTSYDEAFMEIGLPADALAPGHNYGVMLRHPERNDRFTWAASVTTNGKNTADNPNNSKLTVTGRISALPVLAQDGLKLIHVGVSFSDRRPTGGRIRYRARPEARFAPYYADTGDMTSDRVKLVGLELAAVRRSTWMQAEWIRSDVDAPAAGDPTVLGAYLEIGKFLTGEHRSYDQANGTFERVEPNGVYKGGNPFRRIDHRGALEIVGRYSTVDLNDGAVAGGKMRDASLGLNWYLNDSSRVSLNYVHSHLHGVGRSDLILLRFQYNP